METNNDNAVIRNFVERANKQLRLAPSHRAVDVLMEQANIELKGYGVEALSDEKAHVDSYYRNAIALYVNMGDTYDFTVVFDTEFNKFIATSWGDFYEHWKLDNQPVIVLEWGNTYTREALEPIMELAGSGAKDAIAEEIYNNTRINIDPEEARRFLKEYGSWSADELRNTKMNIQRVLWIAAGDIEETGEFYFGI